MVHSLLLAFTVPSSGTNLCYLVATILISKCFVTLRSAINTKTERKEEEQKAFFVRSFFFWSSCAAVKMLRAQIAVVIFFKLRDMYN